MNQIRNQLDYYSARGAAKKLGASHRSVLRHAAKLGIGLMFRGQLLIHKDDLDRLRASIRPKAGRPPKAQV